jgi:hypothetical protein
LAHFFPPLRFFRERWKKESTCSQQAHKRTDPQENVKGRQLGLQHFSRDNEG